MKIETFADGSTITTDEQGNRSVVGSMAHNEYIRRLQDERKA